MGTGLREVTPLWPCRISGASFGISFPPSPTHLEHVQVVGHVQCGCRSAVVRSAVVRSAVVRSAVVRSRVVRSRVVGVRVLGRLPGTGQEVKVGVQD